MRTYGTACPENTRSNLYAAKRPNMSTATLQETVFYCSRGCEMHIQHILHILYIAENKSAEYVK